MWSLVSVHARDLQMHDNFMDGIHEPDDQSKLNIPCETECGALPLTYRGMVLSFLVDGVIIESNAGVHTRLSPTFAAEHRVHTARYHVPRAL